MKRRDVIKGLTILPVAGGIMTGMSPLESFLKTPSTSGIDYFKELGVTPVINADVTMTYLSGSLMRPEVLEAINSTAHDFADMYELQDKVGEKIAEMLKCEGAMVTSGATAALTLGTAAAITGTDQKKIGLLPNLPGPQREVIIQKSHRYPFDQAVRCAGVKLVEVEGPNEMEAAINERTVMALFFNAASSWYGTTDSITHEDFVAISRRHNIPSFIDAAADVPPKENLFKYQGIGFDLVTFSGGKMIRGPQSTGLLFGRKDLIEAAKLNNSPYESPIGRSMKVNKEEIFGMYAALKSYLERDHEEEWQEWLDRVEQISAHVKNVPSVKSQTYISPGPANAFPSLRLNWDQNKINISPKEVLVELKSGTPSIVAGGSEETLNIGVILLRPDQIDVVGRRIKEILEKHA